MKMSPAVDREDADGYTLPAMGKLSRRIFGISLEEVGYSRRGFRGGAPEIRARLENVGRSFLAGYHAALEEDQAESLVARLETIDPWYRGFAYEGAAMSLTLLDALTPWRRTRLRDFLADTGGDHVYMAHVGAGWAIARLPLGMRGVLARLDPLLSWLAFDGYGFHQGFFHWPRTVEGAREVPRRLRGYERRVFDQGLGRSLWFVDGAEIERVASTISRFPASRRPDLWAGIGLASTYTGGVDKASLIALKQAAGELWPQLAQGSAFAAEARRRAGNLVEQTRIASEVFCELTAEAAAELTQETLENLAPAGQQPAYEVWRQRIQDELSRSSRAKIA